MAATPLSANSRIEHALALLLLFTICRGVSADYLLDDIGDRVAFRWILTMGGTFMRASGYERGDTVSSADAQKVVEATPAQPPRRGMRRHNRQPRTGVGHDR